MPRTTLRTIDHKDDEYTFTSAVPSEIVWHDGVARIGAPMHDEERATFGDMIIRHKAMSIVSFCLKSWLERRGLLFDETLIQWSEQRDTERMTTYLYGSVLLV